MLRFRAGLVALVLSASSACVAAQADWRTIKSGTDSTLLALAFVNPDSGFAVGNGTIVRTFNGGETWENVSPDSTARAIECPDSIVQFCDGLSTTFRSIVFNESGRGIAIGADLIVDPRQGRYFQSWVSSILRSVDWGSSWTKTYTESSLLIQRVCFLSDLELIAMGGVGTLLRSVDQGLTWQKELFYPALITESLECPPDGTVWAGGATQAAGRLATTLILHSTDQASSFETLFGELRAGPDPVTSLAVIDSSTAFAHLSTRLLYTEDGGSTWSDRPVSSYVSDISFVDAKNGMSVSLDGRITLTEDGGATWLPEAWFESVRLHAVQLWPDGSAMAVGNAGTIVKRISQGPVSSTHEQPASKKLVVTHFPNPAGVSIMFEIDLPASEPDVRLQIYDVLGRSIALVLSGPLTTGIHNITLATDRLRSGQYVYVLQTARERHSATFTVAR